MCAEAEFRVWIGKLFQIQDNESLEECQLNSPVIGQQECNR